MLLPLLIISCNEDDNGTIESRPCASSQFAPLPDSTCPVEGFIGVGPRGTRCICENEFNEKFLLGLGPSIGDTELISIGMTNYGIMMVDCSTIALFSDSTFTDQVGELQELSSGVEIGSLEFLMFLSQGPTTQEVVCSQCYTGPPPPGCDIQEELLD